MFLLETLAVFDVGLHHDWEAAGHDALAEPLEVVVEPPGGGAVGVVDVETDVAEGGALTHHLERQYQQPWHTPHLFGAYLGGEPPGEGVDVDGLVEHFPYCLLFGGKVRADFGRVVRVLVGLAESFLLFDLVAAHGCFALDVRMEFGNFAEKCYFCSYYEPKYIYFPFDVLLLCRRSAGGCGLCG